MCEHNPRNKGMSYCAYCQVNQLTADIKSLIDKLDNDEVAKILWLILENKYTID